MVKIKSMLEISIDGYIKGEEIHQVIQSKNKNYSDWVRKRIIDADLFKGRDFLVKNLKSTGGRPKQQIEFTIDAAKEICLLERNEQGKKIRRWLIELSKQYESGQLFTIEQFKYVVQLVKVFSYYEYRKLARDKNTENYIENAILLRPETKDYKKQLYKEFNIWRNDMLNLDKSELQRQLIDYCIFNRKRIPNKFTQEQVLMIIDEYLVIKNAVWDLLTSQNKQEEFINNICDLAYEIAKEIKPMFQRLNESNLFNKQIKSSILKQLK